jgi:hypothetical protein
MKKKFKKSDSSVIRGGKRRSNPEKENVHALDCFATLAMTGEWIATSPVGALRNDDGQKIAASSAAMTGEICGQ